MDKSQNVRCSAIKSFIFEELLASMMTYCIGKCKEYKALKPSQIGRYAAGQKRCNYCEVFVEYDGLTCPCCNRQLRCLPRSRKGKEKYLSQIVVKKQLLN